MNTLPHRFSESAFRKYEKVIAQIALSYPRPIRVSPAQFGLSPETIRGRLRDACSSLATHQWPTQLVDIRRFNAIDQSQLTISIQPDGTVVAGNKQTIKEDAIDVIDAVAESEVFDCTHLPSVSSNAALCILAHNQVLKHHLKIKLSIDEFNLFTNSYDIILTPTTTPEIYILS
jgi:hypothetical protein